MKKLIMGVGLSMWVASTACYAATQPQDNSLMIRLGLTAIADPLVCLQAINTTPADSNDCGDVIIEKNYNNLSAAPILQLTPADNRRYQEDPSCQKYFPMNNGLGEFQPKGKYGIVLIKMTFLVAGYEDYMFTNCQVDDESHN